VVEGSLSPVYCLDNPKSCKWVGACVTRDIWEKMKKAMVDVLASITLENMVEMQNKKVVEPLATIYNI